MRRRYSTENGVEMTMKSKLSAVDWTVEGTHPLLGPIAQCTTPRLSYQQPPPIH